MDRNQIQKELNALGYNLSIVAEAIEKSPSLVSKVIARKAKSRFVAEALCKILQKPIEEVFPDIPEYGLPTPVSSSDKENRIKEIQKLLKD